MARIYGTHCAKTAVIQNVKLREKGKFKKSVHPVEEKT